MLDATLWQVNLGDGSWAVCCRSCELTFRGPKPDAELLFTSHRCEPVVPLGEPVGSAADHAHRDATR